MKKGVNVAVTGAAGQIGYALVFRIAAGEMFGPDTPVALSLLELEAALPACNGVVMELADCAFPLLQSVRVSADPAKAFRDADWALLVGSVPRKAGMERADLLRINGGIFVRQGRALDEAAGPDCRVLVVGNPCNTNAFIAKETCRRIPPANFFAMTMLDQNRAVSQLAVRAGRPVTAVSNLAVWGNHSPTMFPDYFHARIDGRAVPEVITDRAWLQGAFLETVQKRGAAVIRARGSSSAASAANAVIDSVRNLSRPAPEGMWCSAAVCADGSYGIPEGLMFSFPVRGDGRRWEIVGGIDHDDFARSRIDRTRDELLEEREAVRDLI